MHTLSGCNMLLYTLYVCVYTLTYYSNIDLLTQVQLTSYFHSPTWVSCEQTIVKGPYFLGYVCGRSQSVQKTPLTTKTDTASTLIADNHNRSSQKTTAERLWKPTPSTVNNQTTSDDVSSQASLSTEFIDLLLTNLNGIYSLYC